jgi:hypothetical protein
LSFITILVAGLFNVVDLSIFMGVVRYYHNHVVVGVCWSFLIFHVFHGQKTQHFGDLFNFQPPPQKKTPHTSMTQKAKDVITQ